MAKVLIIEDDLDYRDILSEILLTSGYEVATVSNGQEAMIYFKDKTADIILLDLFMPKMDGLTFFYHLKNDLKLDIPVIILTNLTETAYPDGIKDFIIKSDTNLDQVVEKVKAYIPQK